LSQELMKNYLKKIFYLIGDDVKKLPWILVLFLTLSLFEVIGLSLIIPYISLIINPEGLSNSYYYHLIIGNIDNKSTENLLVLFGLSLILIFFIKTTLSIIINHQILSFSNKKGANLRKSLLGAYQQMEYQNYLQRNSSEYIHSIQVLATQFSQNTMVAVLKFMSEGLLVLTILIFLALTDIAALMTIFSLIAVFIFFYDFIFGKKIKKFGAEINKYQMKTVAGVNEAIIGFKEIRVLGIENHFNENVSKMAINYAKSYTSVQVLSSVSRYVLELILIVFIVMMVLISIYGDNDLLILVPTLTVFGVASLRLMPAANIFSEGLSQLRFGYNSTNIIYNDLVNHEKEKVSKFTSEVPSIFKELKLDNVSFSYGADSIFENVSLTISKGDSIGIIGSTGSGKTTLINLMLGLLTPSSGNIILNDVIIEGISNPLKGISAYIPQNIFLVDDSVKKNVALGIPDGEIDEGKVFKSLESAKLLDVVNGLPEGIETIIGENGNKLSGGQRQRLSLARAFYYNRQLLIMDEATSALDNVTEKEIAKELKALDGEITTIIVAHRFTTLKDCDHVYEIIDGQVIYRGKYDDII
jgi:ATP-binding cassette, subfamily B, bacterial PglK